MATKPNFLIIVTDDQGYGDAGCYWDTEVDTPTMDAIAKNGVRFTQLRVNPPSATIVRCWIIWMMVWVKSWRHCMSWLS